MRNFPRFFGTIVIMILIIILKDMPICYALSVTDIDDTFLYELYIENDIEPIGYYFIRISGREIITEYHGRNVINIPFLFDTEKKVIMHEKLDQGLKEMKVGGDKYTIKNENGIMIYKNNLKFTNLLEKIPILSIEGLIISFIQSDIAKERLCFWFEGENEQKRLLIQRLSESSKLINNEKMCPVDVVQVNWKGFLGRRDEPMFKFFLSQRDHIPLKIQMISGRWSLILHSIGKKIRFKKELEELKDIIITWKRKEGPVANIIPEQSFQVHRNENDLNLMYKERVALKQDQIYGAVKDVILEKISKKPKMSIQKGEGRYRVFVEESEVETMLRELANRENKGLIRSENSYYFEEYHSETIKSSQLIDIYASQKDEELAKLFKSSFNIANGVFTGIAWKQTHLISCK